MLKALVLPHPCLQPTWGQSHLLEGHDDSLSEVPVKMSQSAGKESHSTQAVWMRVCGGMGVSILPRVFHVPAARTEGHYSSLCFSCCARRGTGHLDLFCGKKPSPEPTQQNGGQPHPVSEALPPCHSLPVSWKHGASWPLNSCPVDSFAPPGVGLLHYWSVALPTPAGCPCLGFLALCQVLACAEGGFPAKGHLKGTQT